jgi:hypothetical protein
MAADTANRERGIKEELHLYGLVRDDAEAVRIHVQEAKRHLAEAESEIRRIIESVQTLEDKDHGCGLSPFAVKSVLGAALFLLDELHEHGNLASLPTDSLEMAELTELVNKQARRLNDRDDDV